jgi:hypothetical protein
MSGTGRDYSWLPEHQTHVALTLAHADDLIARAADIYFAYIQPGPLEFENVDESGTSYMKVRAVAPLPAAVARYAADALTQLRAAIEHAIYAEVEEQLGRELTRDEGRQIEMPACIKEKDLQDWLRKRPRRELAPLRNGAPLVTRIRDLQPYHRRDFDQHPLRILAEHTNHAKHRAPAVAATRVGAVIPDFPSPEVQLAKSETGGPARPGDVLARSPSGVVVPVSIWPEVSIRRPHTGTWHVLMKELRSLEDWVRTVAIPLLVIGIRDVDPLPPQLDTTVGYDDVRAALASAGEIPAVQRLDRRIRAGIARVTVVDILATYEGGPDRAVIQAWVDGLSDDELLEKLDRLTQVVRNPVALAAVVRALLSEAHRSGRTEG